MIRHLEFKAHILLILSPAFLSRPCQAQSATTPQVATSPAPAQRNPSPAMATDASLIPPQQTLTAKHYADWPEMGRAFLAEHPNDHGLAKLIGAIGIFDYKALLDQTKAIDAVLNSGWSAVTPQIDSTIRSNAAALDSAFASAQLSPFALPPVLDYTGMVPNFLAVQFLMKCMCLTARMAESTGDLAQAVQRTVLAMRFAESFVASDTLIAHLIGVAGLGVSAKTLAAILRNPALPVPIATWTFQALQVVEPAAYRLPDVIRAEAVQTIRSMRRMRTDPKPPDPFDKSPDTAAALKLRLERLPEFEKEQDRVYRAVAANYEKPYWRRDRIDDQQIRKLATVPGFFAGPEPHWDEAAVRTETSIAKIRLCQVLAALRANKQDEAAKVRDRFADRAMGILPDRVYSVGPDAIDQAGAITYDPTNGTVSPGDVVFMR